MKERSRVREREIESSSQGNLEQEYNGLGGGGGGPGGKELSSVKKIKKSEVGTDRGGREGPEAGCCTVWSVRQ